MSSLCYRRTQAGDWLMHMGPADGPAILFLPPLFEEMNRTRALIAAAMRRLAERGFQCWLIDLPGTGESERALETVAWQDWRDAVAAAGVEIGPLRLVASVRGGGLLDDAVAAPAHWRLAPVAGASLRRDLSRAGLAGGADKAGYPVSEPLLAALDEATPGERPGLRTIRLASDPQPADNKIEGPALWRRSEPGNSILLAESIAEDIADWAGQCAAS